MKELGCSNKPPPSASPTEASSEDAPAEDAPTEANGLNGSSADLKFLIKVV